MHTLSPEQWRVLAPYLDQALEMDDTQRAAWLSALAAENPAIASQLEPLLAEHAELAKAGFMEAGVETPPFAEQGLAGQVIGAYTLVSHIGQGGMSTVWLAERNDGRFVRSVAVKFLNLALVGRANEERFKREGNILGRLAHPHIAELVDAGVSTGGFPYLVLEYVEGDHINRYCDLQKLDIEERIRLFLDVASAVAHAHANLIVHRDLKPSNVLVSKDGQVKLLDFGIAKLIETEAGDTALTALTAPGGQVLTPEYAAPEQVTGAPITTATDVYALGILLYVLLTGQHPAGPSLQSPAQLVKAIVDTEPQRLSEIVTDSKADPKTVTENAAHRTTTPDKLRRQLRGDLDTIVAKALKKDPQERYASVVAFADDLRRYLDHEPISARPDSFSYRAAKFVRRNRAVVGLASLLAMATIAGVVGVLIQARTARRQRDFALEQLKRSEEHDELLNFLLYNAPKGKIFSVADLLARAEQVVEKQQSSNAARRADLWMWLAEDYSSEDQPGKARVLAEKAYALSSGLPDPSMHARAACVLATTLSGIGELKRAEELVKEGLHELPDDPQHALDRVNCLQTGGDVAQAAGQMQLAIDRMETAERVVTASPLATDALRMRTVADLAWAYSFAGKNPESLAGYERAAAFLPSLGYEDTVTAAKLFGDWAVELDQIGRTLEAEKIEKRAIMSLQVGNNFDAVPPNYLIDYAKMLYKLNRLDDAADLLQRAYDKGKVGQNRIVMGQSLIVLTRIAIAQRKFDLAVARLSELDPLMHRILPPGHYAFSVLTTDRAMLALGQGDISRAADISNQAVAIGQAALAKDKAGLFTFSTLLLNDSLIALTAGKPEQALSDADRLLAIQESSNQEGALSAKAGNAYLARARALEALGRRDEARAAARVAVERLERSVGRDNPETQSAQQLADTPSANH